MIKFRYNFKKKFQDQLENFAKCHKGENIETFKDSFDIWCNKNVNNIDNELKRLNVLGYNGDINDKMFKSARYYLKKDEKVKKNKTRKKYTGKNFIFLEKVKNHIDSLRIYIKPKDAYINFCELNKEHIDNLKNKLINNENYDEKSALKKIKKIYINKYYVKFH